jgi:hypothetical protein
LDATDDETAVPTTEEVHITFSSRGCCMRYLRLALLPLVFAACTEQAPVAPIEDGPAFNFMNNDGWLSNGKIFRHGHEYEWLGWDVDRQLIGHFGTVAAVESFCGLGEDLEPIATQHIYNNPDVADEIQHLIQQGDVWVKLYDWTGLWDPFVCDNWANADFLASGEMRIVTTDNDVLAYYGGHTQNNAFGLNGSGRLALGAGGFTNINYVFRETWNPDKGFAKVIEKLNISNDPR